MAGRLSEDQVKEFEREGFLLYQQPVFSPEKFSALKDHFEKKLSTWAQDSGGRSPEAMDVPHFSDTDLFEWLFAPEVLDLVEPLLGPDIALWSSHFISKPAGVGKRVPWHEDSAYWGEVLNPMEVVTVWLAIDPSTPVNGCMRVIPRSHSNGYSEYEDVKNPEEQVFAKEIIAGNFDDTKAADCVLEPNQCSIHHAKLIHGSEPNTSDIRRCGYTMRYVPASSRFRPEVHGHSNTFQIYLARGEDKAGNAYGDPTKVNEKWLAADAKERMRVRRLAG